MNIRCFDIGYVMLASSPNNFVKLKNHENNIELFSWLRVCILRVGNSSDRPGKIGDGKGLQNHHFSFG